MAFSSALLIRSGRVLRRFPAVVAAALLVLTLACSHLQEEEPVRSHRLVVLHTNDTHGHPVAFDHHPSKNVGGLPARATLVERIRSTGADVLLLDAGDINTGCMVSNLFQAKPDIRGFNALGYDAMALGNHEFDQPIDVLRRQMSWAAFPFLSANIRTREGALLATSHVIRSFDGFRVAVFGLTTPETRIISNPDHVKDLVFEDPVTAAKRLVPELRKEADMVIALTHLGVYSSSDRGSRRLATEVEGIDLIVDGHSHTRLEQPIVVHHPGTGRQTLVVQAWKWGLVLGKLEMDIRDGRIDSYSYALIPVRVAGTAGEKGVPEDADLVRMLRPYVEKTAREGSRVIGRAEGTFPNERVREEETALGDLVADAMLWSARDLEPDFAIQNGGGIRAPLAAGPVTVGDIHAVLPFDNTVTVLDLSGRDVRAVLDRGASMGKGRGGFLQVSGGLRVAFRRGSGRCDTIHVNGRPLQDDRIYRVVTLSYLAGGGDGYAAFLKAGNRTDTSRFQRDVLVDYIAFLGGAVRPEIRNRIRILPAGTTGSRLRLRDARSVELVHQGPGSLIPSGQVDGSESRGLGRGDRRKPATVALHLPNEECVTGAFF